MSFADPEAGTDGPLLAVSIDAGRLAAGLVDDDGTVLVRDRVSTPGREVWRTLEQLLRRVLAAAPQGAPGPRSVGASCSGPIDEHAGSVSPLEIPAWTGFPLRDHLEGLLGRPAVVGSTAAAAAEAERWIGQAVGLRSYLTILCDATFESACIVDGSRLRGAHGNAGSLAHVLVDPGGRRCVCGANGCLSAYVSGSALEAELNRPLRRATPSLVERTGIMLGRALASSAALLDVTTVFFSGTVIDVFGDPMIAAMRRELEIRSRLASLEGIRTVETTGSVPQLVAAAALAREAPATDR